MVQAVVLGVDRAAVTSTVRAKVRAGRSAEAELFPRDSPDADSPASRDPAGL